MARAYDPQMDATYHFNTGSGQEKIAQFSTSKSEALLPIVMLAMVRNLLRTVNIIIIQVTIIQEPIA